MGKLGLAAILVCLPLWAGNQAMAAEGGHGGGHSEGRGKHSGGGHDGHDLTGDEDEGHGGGHGGSRGKGHSGRGGAGAGGRATDVQVLRGRRPVWAGPDFPEVELGRLNVSRAPTRVLDHARMLAVEELPSGAGSLYGLTAEEAAVLMEMSFGSVQRLHSPVQNLALYREVMTFGEIEFFDFQPASQLDLAAIFLASAAERSKPITEDTVRALNLILGLVELNPSDRALLASKAETVREGMEIGHGPEGDHDDDEGSDHGSGGSPGAGEDHDHG